MVSLLHVSHYEKWTSYHCVVSEFVSRIEYPCLQDGLFCEILYSSLRAVLDDRMNELLLCLLITR